MAARTNIEWADSSWNPVVGCSLVSPGCTNCYAMRWAHAGMKPVKHYHGTTRSVNGKPVWTGKVAQAPEHILTAPLRWKKPRRIFVNSMGDLFHEDCPDDWIDKVFAVMALCPQHTFQVLTKRAKRMREYLNRIEDEPQHDTVKRFAVAMPNPWPKFGTIIFPLANVWAGVSAEDQARADERIPDLLATLAAVRFVSAEPLIGPVRLDMLNREPDAYDLKMPGFATVEKFYTDALGGASGIQWKDGHAERETGGHVGLDWVIVGGESGPGARPLDMGWARSIVRQCQAAGVRCFVKQLGPQPYETMGSTMRHDDPNDIFGTMEKAIANPPPKGWTRVHYGSETRLYRYHRLKDRKGGDMIEWPEDLRVREMP